MKYALYALCVNAHKYSGCADCGLTKEPPQTEGGVQRDPESSLSQGTSACTFGLFLYYTLSNLFAALVFLLPSTRLWGEVRLIVGQVGPPLNWHPPQDRW